MCKVIRPFDRSNEATVHSLNVEPVANQNIQMNRLESQKKMVQSRVLGIEIYIVVCVNDETKISFEERRVRW